MASVLQKVLDKLDVTIKVRELAGTPAKGFPAGARTFRVTLARPDGKNEKDEPQEARLTVAYHCGPNASAPTTVDVVDSLRCDVASGELTFWEFSQENGGMPKEDAERVHKACVRIVPRVKRFFGKHWAHVATASLNEANGEQRATA